MYQLPGFEKDFIYADINHGVDFERAQERLQAEAGKAFRAYLRAKRDPQASPSAVQELQDAYVQANEAAQRLRADDAAGIAAVLGG
jgi:hypothetical protein